MTEIELKVFNNVKIRLQLSANVDKDALLEILVKEAINNILLYVGEDVLPTKLEGVCENLTCAVYRKVGAEGMKSETVDSVTYTYAENALISFIPFLDKYISNRDNISSRVVRFY